MPDLQGLEPAVDEKDFRAFSTNAYPKRCSLIQAGKVEVDLSIPRLRQRTIHLISTQFRDAISLGRKMEGAQCIPACPQRVTVT